MAKIPKLIEDYDQRFRSGNDIKIDRVWMTKEMWEELRKVLVRAESDRKELSDRHWIGVK